MRGAFRKYQDIIYALILSLTISFMLFLYEPITMYANNTNDFWFDYYTLIGPTSLFFLLTFVGIFIGLFIVYLFAKLIKHPKLYHFILVFVTICFVGAYIHSNFLAGFLPPLDGTTFDWSDPFANITSIATCLILIILAIVSIIKLGSAKTIRYSAYLSLAIFAMLLVSLITTFATTPVFEPKEIFAASTDKNLNLMSTNKNYMVFLVDAVDSTHFNKIVEQNEDYQVALKDFSYFPDTLSGYAFTRDSIPFIFSGKWNENKEPFSEYSTDAFDNSPFFAALSNQNYNKNFYDIDFTWRSRKALEFENITSIEKNVVKRTFLKQELKYILFKTLPFPLKRFSRIDNMNFTWAQTKQENDSFLWGDINFYDNYLKQSVSKTDDKYFQYVHIEGAHVPFDVSSNVAYLPNEDGTYEDKLEATMKIIAAYLERLKENGAYDNATIVILADHGFWYEGTSRANPILYIKGENETHDQMIISDKQVSYVDLCETFIELLNGKDSTEIFSDLPTEGRIRRFIYNGFNEEEHMYEYEQTGKAWETETLNKTGKEYDL